MSERPGTMELWDIHRSGTSLEKFRAMYADPDLMGGIAYPSPPQLCWTHWQGEAAAHRQKTASDRQARERFTERTGIKLYAKTRLADLSW